MLQALIDIHMYKRKKLREKHNKTADHFYYNTTVLDGRVHYKELVVGNNRILRYTKHNTSKTVGSTTLLVMGISG